MSATLKMIEERYGGVEGYVMDKCGLSIKDVEQIRQNLISREQPIR